MFAVQRDRSKVYEVAVMNWLRLQRGYFVLPAYDFSGLANNKAPKLRGKSSDLILPDLYGARTGETAWFEVKLKERADLYRKTNTLVTGLPVRHWNDYQEVKRQTGMPVWVVFIHEHEETVVCGEIAALKANVSHIYGGGKMDFGGTIFFVFNKLRPLMPIKALQKFM